MVKFVENDNQVDEELTEYLDRFEKSLDQDKKLTLDKVSSLIIEFMLKSKSAVRHNHGILKYTKISLKMLI